MSLSLQEEAGGGKCPDSIQSILQILSEVLPASEVRRRWQERDSDCTMS